MNDERLRTMKRQDASLTAIARKVLVASVSRTGTAVERAEVPRRNRTL